MTLVRHLFRDGLSEPQVSDHGKHTSIVDLYVGSYMVNICPENTTTEYCHRPKHDLTTTPADGEFWKTSQCQRMER